MRALFNRLLLAASTAFLYVSPLLAESSQSELPPASLTAWVDRVNARVDAAMVAPVGVEGQAMVSFRRADDGRIADIRVVTAEPGLDRAARATVRRLVRLPPLPQGIDPHQRIALQLLWDDGPDARAYQAKRRALLAAADAANGRLSGDLTMIAVASAK